MIKFLSDRNIQKLNDILIINICKNLTSLMYNVHCTCICSYGNLYICVYIYIYIYYIYIYIYI